MNIIYLLLPLALLLVLVFVLLYLWAVMRGQFDDLDSPSKRMLLDDKPISSAQNKEENSQENGSDTDFHKE